MPHPYVVKIDHTSNPPVGQICEWGQPWNCYNTTLACDDKEPWHDGGIGNDTLTCFSGNCTMCGGDGLDTFEIYPTVDGPVTITDLGLGEKIGLFTNDTENNTVCSEWVGGWEVMLYNLNNPPFSYNVTLDCDGLAKICWLGDPEHFCEFISICPEVHEISFS